MNPQPWLAFDPALPISAKASGIISLIRDHQIIVVADGTGSGKAIQLLKVCLPTGRERIAHTQPRRITAHTVAHRIAEGCGTQLGEFVSYQVRFTRRVNRTTRIKVITDGVLLSELAHGHALERYDTIIIDEAHERSLSIDFLFDYLKQPLEHRPELRVIVTSATTNTARFTTHFDDMPIMEVPGHTYPAGIHYRPVGEDDDRVDAVTAAVGDLVATTSSGDVLVFLSGEREIHNAADTVGTLRLPSWGTVPLYTRLAAVDRQKVSQAHSDRRVMLITSVVETPIMVPDIRLVIGAGTARISRYSARTRVQRPPVEPVSQASANQRAGRCGRLGLGVAIRLYSEEDFNSHLEFTEPKILRTSLATAILQMAQAGLSEIESFPFMEAPVTPQISNGLRVLQELGTIKPRRRRERVRFTRTGRLLIRMPVDPRLGRMLIEGTWRSALRQMQVIVAGLTAPDVRGRPSEHQQAVDELHRRFTQSPASEAGSSADGESKRHTIHTGTRPVKQGRDSLAGGNLEALLNIWEYLRKRHREFSGSTFRRLCRAEFLHSVRFREQGDLVSQLRGVCREPELPDEGDAAMDVILDCLLTGLLSNIGLALPPPPKVRGRRHPLAEYQGTRGVRFAITPGSACSRSTPPLVVACELVETSWLWACTVSPVTAAQIERAAGDLMTRTLSRPMFLPRSATVTVSETVTLFRMPIISGRRTNYTTSHPGQAREIFIRIDLVEREWKTRDPVVIADRFAYDEVERLTDRMRRPGLLVSDQALHDFYAARLPAEAASGATLDRYVKSLSDDSALRLAPTNCMTSPGAFSVADFPDQWQVSGLELPVSYVYDPGTEHNGVAVKVRLEQLEVLEPESFTWQMPGLHEDLATALIRSLPERIHTSFVPAPDFVRRAMAWLRKRGAGDETAFPGALGRALTTLTGEQVASGD